MATPALNPMPPFDPDTDLGADLAARWRIWLDDFNTYLVASNITNDKRKRALLLYQAGSRVREIFRNLEETGEDFDTAVTKLNDFFKPQKNRLFEVYKFRQAVQGQSESLDQFHTRLRTLATNCDFHDAEFEVQVQIVIGGRSNRLRKLALRDPDCKLADMLLAGRREETSTVQAAEIEKKIDDKPILAVKKKSKKQHLNKENNSSERKGDSPKTKSCFNCGGEYPHKSTCPAKNKRCNNCGKLNHFARQCQSNRRQRNPSSTIFSSEQYKQF